MDSNMIHMVLVPDRKVCRKCGDRWPCETERQRRVIQDAHNALEDAYPNRWLAGATLHDKIIDVLADLGRYEEEAYNTYAGEWEDED